MGYQPTQDAVLHLTLAWRPTKGAEQPLGATDFTSAATDGGVGAWNASLPASATPAACGDSLVLRVQFASGSSPFTEFRVELTTP